MHRFRQILIVLLTLVCYVQTSAMPFFKQINVSDGLAHPSVLSVCQDSLGRIWFGTENGVSIYDGNRIISLKPYNNINNVSFKGGIVSKIVCDKNGDVFFITESELVRRDSKTEIIEVLKEGQFNALYIEDGSLQAIEGQDIYTFSDGRLTRTDSAKFEGISACHTDSNGRKWTICNAGLYCQEKKISGLQNLYAILETRNGDIYVTSNGNGFLRISVDGNLRHFTTTSDKGLISNNIRSIAEDRQGNIWFGTFSGLQCYHPDTDKFESFTRENRDGGLSHSSVFALLIDRNGILWAGTYYGGVNYTDTRLDLQSFFPFTQQRGGLSHPVVGHLEEDRHGRIWICTEGGGINRLDPKSGEVTRFENQPFTNAKWVCLDESGNNVYIGTNRKGLYRLDVSSGNFTQELTSKYGKESISVINIVKRFKDELILSCDEGIFLHSLENGRDSLLYPCTDGVRYVHIIVEGEDLWLASSNVVRINLRTKTILRTYPIMSGQEKIRPMRLLFKDSELYATTFGNGIFKLKDGRFTPLEINDPKVRNGYQILPYGKENFIVSSENGIFIMNTYGEILQSYYPGINLPVTAPVMDSGLLLSENGTLYASGTNGLTSFNLEGLEDNTHVNIYFSEFYINGSQAIVSKNKNGLKTAVPYCSKISVTGIQEHLALYLASDKLTGMNWEDYEFSTNNGASWASLQEPKISLSNVPVGKYTILVRKKGERHDSACLTISVKPQWYASFPAKILYLLFVSAIIYILFRMYITRKETQMAVEEERRDKARIQELNENKLRFFTTISHELRTPLTLIIAQLDLISHTFNLPPLVKNKLGKATNEAKQMNQLVSELIDFRKFEQNLVTLHIAPFYVNAFVSSIFNKFGEMAAGKDIHLGFNPCEENPIVWGDSFQLQKVIMNLIFNALKFTPENGIIRIETKDFEDRVSISVKDSGIGIKKEELEHIFERFYQTDENKENRIPGSGIGLALVKDIIERHHGCISVKSEYGKGSEFTVIIPKSKSAFAGDEMAVIQDKAKISDAEGTGIKTEQDETDDKGRPTIVIAEDNMEMLGILKELFSVQYKVVTATDGADALEKIKTVRPDIVLTDEMMPKMSGTELTGAIRNDAHLKHIPIVLLTAIDGAEQKIGALIKGANDYIAKPFNSRMLLARCNNLISNTKENNTREKDLAKIAANKEEKEFLEKLRKHIEENLSNVEMNNDDLAKMMNMSRSSFYQRFKQMTRETPSEFISSVRLARACKLLLEEPKLSVAEISDITGFSSSNYFCRKFKAKYKVSPARYRNEGGK